MLTQIVYTVRIGGIRNENYHEGAFKPLGNYDMLQWINKIFDLKSVESLVTIDRKLLIELLEMMKDQYVTLSIVNNKGFAPKPFLKLDGENNNAFIFPILSGKNLNKNK